MGQRFEPTQFELQQLAEGVYAALGTIEGCGTVSNAGIIDLGDQTLVFDTFELPAAGQELRQATEYLTGRPPSYIVISHSHSDHWVGNQAFEPQIPILANRVILENMPLDTAWLDRYRQDPSQMQAYVAGIQESLVKESAPQRRLQLQAATERMGGLLEALPTLKPRLPGLLLEGKATFHGDQRTAVLHTVAPGHTASDLYLVLPEDRIVFMGDLGFFHSQPFMAFCDPLAWQAWLQEMEAVEDIEIFVPGHGPTGDHTDLKLQRIYIAALEEMVAQVRRDGGTVQDALTRSLPAPFDEWIQTGPGRWEANVRSAYDRQPSEPAG
jgi:glyoxylase-like metal-dependent hydrolase (beta-lactamase superfamily II)